jgi:hypothetical protein
VITLTLLIILYYLEFKWGIQLLLIPTVPVGEGLNKIMTKHSLNSVKILR